MGRDKASLPLDNAPLAVQTAELLSSVCHSVKLVGARECFGLPAIEDERPGSGPLGGIVSALAQTTSEWNLIVACDMPGLTRAFLESLQARAEARSVDCVVPRTPSGRVNPLCAAYRRTCETRLRSAFDSGIRSPRKALLLITCDFWDTQDVAALCSVNTPEEWEAFLRERTPE